MNCYKVVSSVEKRIPNKLINIAWIVGFFIGTMVNMVLPYYGAVQLAMLEMFFAVGCSM